MEHGWLVRGMQLIDPTLVLSLTCDQAVFFSPVYCLTKNLNSIAFCDSWRAKPETDIKNLS
jgi:hypothetical protein